jgi:hypothetical protein
MHPALVLGGVWGGGFTPDSNGQRIIEWAMNTPLFTRNERGSRTVLAGIGVDDATMSVMNWKLADESFDIRLMYDSPSKSWGLVHANTADRTAYQITGEQSPEGPCQIRFPRGFYIATNPGGVQVKVGLGSAPPTGGTWNRGDRVLNAEPTAGGYEGWICVAGGAPGVWKPFGPVAA